MTITNELVSVSARYAIEFADKAVPIVRKQISTAQVYANGSGAKNGLTGIKRHAGPYADRWRKIVLFGKVEKWHVQ